MVTHLYPGSTISTLLLICSCLCGFSHCIKHKAKHSNEEPSYSLVIFNTVINPFNPTGHNSERKNGFHL